MLPVVADRPSGMCEPCPGPTVRIDAHESETRRDPPMSDQFRIFERLLIISTNPAFDVYTHIPHIEDDHTFEN